MDPISTTTPGINASINDLKADLIRDLDPTKDAAKIAEVEQTFERLRDTEWKLVRGHNELVTIPGRVAAVEGQLAHLPFLPKAAA